MAKWKNALLISTIVAPVAFGAAPLGDALASAKKSVPTTTDVKVHKFVANAEGSTLSGDEKTNYYWGNGSVGTSDATDDNPFTNSTQTASEGITWTQAQRTGYEFTAYNLPEYTDGATQKNKLISFPKTITVAGEKVAVPTDKPVISDDFIPGSTTVRWSDVIKPVKQVATATSDDDSVNAAKHQEQGNKGNSKVNPYALQWVGTDAELALLQGAGYATSGPEAVNPSTGIATFNDLATANSKDSDGNKNSGNWLIVETSAAPDVSEKAVPIVLSLPMMDPKATNADDDDDYWFDGTSHALNLYAKDYSVTGDLTVNKIDSNTNTEVAGAYFGLFHVTDAEATAFNAAVKELTDAAAGGTQYADEAAAEAAFAKLETAAKSTAPVVDPYEYTEMSDGTKSYKFAGLVPGETYKLIELATPTADYIQDFDVKSITIDPVSEGTGDTDATEDGTASYTGGKVDVTNFENNVDKQIRIAGVTSGVGPYEQEPGDKVQGIDRGQDFEWIIKGDLPKVGVEKLTTYTINDTIPYQTNWLTGTISVDGLTGPLFSMEHLRDGKKLDVTVGDTGSGLAYDNWGGDDDFAADDTLTRDNVSLTGNAANIAAALTDEQVAKIFGTGVTKATLTDAIVNNWIKTNVQIKGVSSIYDWTDDKRTTTKDTRTPGEMTIDFNTADSRLLLQYLASASTDADPQIDVTLNARANSAAQADAIKNHVELVVNGNVDSSTKTDDVETFDAGWELVKKNGSGEALAGAKFDLAVNIPGGDSDAAVAKRDALLNNFYDGKASNGDGTVVYGSDDDTKQKPITIDGKQTTVQALWEQMYYAAATSEQFLADDTLNTTVIWNDDTTYPTKDEKKAAIVATAYTGDYDPETDSVSDANSSTNLRDRLVSMMDAGDYQSPAEGGSGTLYFMHKDAVSGAAEPEMDMGATGVVMGDVIWTPVAAWATTHVTAADGYLQYCGLAAGDYALIEREAPSGYQLGGETVYLGQDTAAGVAGTKFDHAVLFGLGSADDTTVKNPYNGKNSGKIDGLPTSDDIQFVNYQKSIFPLVGGLGTLFAVIAGLLAMGLALLKRKKDMKNEA